MFDFYQSYRRQILFSLLACCAVIQVLYLVRLRYYPEELGKQDRRGVSAREFARREEKAAELVLDWQKRPTLRYSELTSNKIDQLLTLVCDSIPSEAVAVNKNDLPVGAYAASNVAFAELMQIYMNSNQVKDLIAFNARRGESLPEEIRMMYLDQLTSLNIITQSIGESMTTEDMLEKHLEAGGGKIPWDGIVDGVGCRSFYLVHLDAAACLGESPAAKYGDVFNNSFFSGHLFAIDDKSAGQDIAENGMFCCDIQFVASLSTGDGARFPMCIRMWFDGSISQWRSIILVGSRTSDYQPVVLF